MNNYSRSINLVYLYTSVISASASAIPFPPAPDPPTPLLPLVDLLESLPSIFPFRSRYNFPIWFDLFNLVALLGRKNLTVPTGGGGGAAAPFTTGICGRGGRGVSDTAPNFPGGGGGGGGIDCAAVTLTLASKWVLGAVVAALTVLNLVRNQALEVE